MVGFFETKYWFPSEPLKFQRRKFAVKNAKESEVSPKTQKIWLFETYGFSENNFSTSLKSLKVSNIP